ncbi:MAG: DUF3311 domain-containing protein [Alphaproteobacteria bacterium]
MPNTPDGGGEVRHVSWTRWLLTIPFIAVLWVPFYNSVEPTLWSIPLFYWYQLLWVPLCAVVIGIVYFAEERG